MLFTSYEFILFIIIVFAAYYLLPRRAQWPLLLAASLSFYALSDWHYLFFIGITSVTVWFAGIKIGRIGDEQKAYIAEHKSELTKEERKAYKAAMTRRKWKWLIFAALINIGILCVTKYTNFVITNINKFLSAEGAISAVDIIVPMGISFYTFQAVGYIIDVWRGTQEPQKNPLKFLLFVSFFPQLVQGPISRYGDLEKTLFTPHAPEPENISRGLARILWGYFKKVVIADRIITGVTTLIGEPETYSGGFVFVAMVFYAFELYCDFTGGIDITIGIAEVMGIRVTENFNLPYLSKTTKEYWNRWHITMGTWFTDYIFYPISISAPMRRLSKWSRAHLGNAVGKRVPVYISVLVVWFTTGIWHGAAWNFIVWGLLNAVIILVSQELEPFYRWFHGRFKVSGRAWYEIFRILRTCFLMSMIRMFDCYRDVPLTFRMIGSMFTRWNAEEVFGGALMNIGLSAADYGVLLFGFVAVFAVSIYKYRTNTQSVRDVLMAKPAIVLYGVMAALAVVIIVFGAYGIGYDSSQFIYNQF